MAAAGLPQKSPQRSGAELSEILPPLTGGPVNSLIRRPIESRLKVSSYYLLNMDLVL